MESSLQIPGIYRLPMNAFHETKVEKRRTKQEGLYRARQNWVGQDLTRENQSGQDQIE